MPEWSESDERVAHAFRLYAQAAGLVASGIGAGVLLSHALGHEELASVREAWPDTPVISGVLALADGVALSLGARRATGRARRAADGFAAMTLAVAAAAGVEALAGAGGGGILPEVQRPSSWSVGCFLLLATAQLLRGRRDRLAELLAALTLVVATVALLAFAFDVEQLLGVERAYPVTGMSLPAALAVLAIGAGTIAARPEAGIASLFADHNIGGLVARRLFAALLLFPAAAVLVDLGERLEWYDARIAFAMTTFFVLAGGVAVILITSSRLGALGSALGEAEERYRTLFDQASDGIFIADVETARYTDVNEAGARMLGFTREELLSRRITDLIRPEDVPRLEKAQEAMREGKTQVAEWDIRRKDGAWLPVELSEKLLPDGRWQAFVRDISERKKAEAKLTRAAETERVLRAELEALTKAEAVIAETLVNVPEKGVAGVLRSIAREARRLAGARYAALGLGEDPKRPFEPWAFDGMDKDVAESIGRFPRPVGTLGIPAIDGEVVRVPDVREHRDYRGLPEGHPEITSLLAVPVRYGSHAGNLYLGNKEDGDRFTEDDERVVRTLAERTGTAIAVARIYEREQAQRSWLQSILEQLPEAVVVLDEDGQLLEQSRVAEELASDTDRTDPDGRPLLHDYRTPEGDLLPAERVPSFRVLSEGRSVVAEEIALEAPGGRLVPVHVSATAVRTPGGGPGALLVMQDVTAQKELERLREEWASVVAHDLRQPVSTIRLSAETLLLRCKERLESAERRSLERILADADRLGRMTGDLLDSSRIEARRLELDLRETDMAKLLERAAGELAEEARAEDREIVVEAADVTARVDPDRVLQVLANLLSNALKYGDPGTPVTVECLADEGDREVEVRVTNEGPEIPAEDRRKLFTRFARASSAGVDEKPGLGLGLYISRGLVEAHGGRIDVESGGGRTTFSFRVPRHGKEARAPEETSEEEAEPRAPDR